LSADAGAPLLRTLAPAAARFAHIRRVWDATLDRPLAKLLPGDYYVTCQDEVIFTVLGSCVSACVRDRKLGIGGMNHFMLPQDHSDGAASWGGRSDSSATRYGDVAMDRLVNDILELGGHREDLEFKIMGGGNVLDMALEVGTHNVQFARDYLRKGGFHLAAEDLGGKFARKLYYSPKSGNARVKRLTATVNRVVFEREQGVASGCDNQAAAALRIGAPDRQP
jgi:chemotaxis protein CheD